MTDLVIKQLEPARIELLRQIDRTEQLAVEYTVEGGELVPRETSFLVPAWDSSGMGSHSVNRLIEFCSPYLEAGAQLMGAFEGDLVVGLSIVEARLRPGLSWLALLHVTSGRRRSGVGKALWNEAEQMARESGAAAIYVSATPTGSAVNFYLQRGCRLATQDEIIPELFELEPDDVHLICSL